MLKGILFDMDGTLIDSEPVHYRAYQEALAPMGYSLPYEEYSKITGCTRPAILAMIKNLLGPLNVSDETFDEQVAANKAAINAREGYPIVAGVREMLAQMQAAGFRMAVASSSPQSYIEHVVASLGIGEYFELLVSGETVEHPKPEPDIFLKAAEELGLKPEECLVVEDSYNGVLAACRAEMATAAFLNPSAFGQDLSMATGAFTSFDRLTPEWAQSLRERFQESRG